MNFIFLRILKNSVKVFLSIIFMMLILNLTNIINLTTNKIFISNAMNLNPYIDDWLVPSSYSDVDRLINFYSSENDSEDKSIVTDKFVAYDKNKNPIYEHLENPKDTDPIKFRYILNDDDSIAKATLISIDNGLNDDIVIPYCLGGCPVTEIADNACKGLDFGFIKIPSNVESIGENAFADCTWLYEIIFDEKSNLKIIEDGAFSGCCNLESIHIPYSVNVIGKNAFANNKSLERVCLDAYSQLNFIGNDAFNGCCNLESICIPCSVNVIGENAFANNTSLESVHFDPSSNLKVIGDGAFSGCIKLNTIYKDIENVENAGAFIPQGVEKIGANAFANNTSLESVHFDPSSNLKVIGDGAFSGCCNLESICIPCSVNIIGKNAFANNTSLKYVFLESDSELISIGKCAFNGCSCLNEILIPKKVISIGDDTFSGCTNLKYIGLVNGFELTEREGIPDKTIISNY